MPIIVPTITAENPHTFREQIERVNFADRIHIDLMDGIFTPNKSVDIQQIWLPEDKTVDVHVMYEKPETITEALRELAPQLVTVHTESKCDIKAFSDVLHSDGIKFGLALFPETKVSVIQPYISQIDHVLIFSGNLGYQGGSVAKLELLEKVKEISSLVPGVEIGWDGGLNDQNIHAISHAGVEVLNVGSYIHTNSSPGAAYSKLQSLIA